MINFFVHSVLIDKKMIYKTYVLLLIYYAFMNQYQDNVEDKEDMKLDQVSEQAQTPQAVLSL